VLLHLQYSKLFKINYLRQGGYAFISIHSFICLLAERSVTRRLYNSNTFMTSAALVEVIALLSEFLIQKWF